MSFVGDLVVFSIVCYGGVLLVGVFYFLTSLDNAREIAIISLFLCASLGFLGRCLLAFLGGGGRRVRRHGLGSPRRGDSLSDIAVDSDSNDGGSGSRHLRFSFAVFVCGFRLRSLNCYSRCSNSGFTIEDSLISNFVDIKSNKE
jgi:hypothetical protein